MATIRAPWFALVVVGLLGMCVAGATADNLYVPGQYATIQAAIDAALPGDEVVVADGVYTGASNKNLDFLGKDITVRSAGGDPTLCAIDCEGSGRGFYLHSGETVAATVRGMTICNGYVNAASPGGAFGGGLYVGAGGLTLIDCIVRDNVASSADSSSGRGGGLYAANSTLNATGCEFSGNTAGYQSGQGGGLFVASGTGTLTGCTISGNEAAAPLLASVSYGGGLAGSGDLTLIDCAISGNTSDVAGGLDGSGFTLSGCTISDNHAVDGTAGGAALRGSAFMTDCVVSGNSAYAGASGLTVDDTALVSDCTVMNNTNGGARCTGNAYLIRCSISDNAGYGVICERYAVLTWCRIEHNQGRGVRFVSEVYSAPFLSHSYVQGNRDGGVLCDGVGTPYMAPTLANCVVAANVAAQGAAVFCKNGTQLRIACCTLAGNLGTQGRALACDSSGTPSSVTVTNCTFWNGGNEIWNNDGSTLSIRFSDVYGGWTGLGNKNADPLFVRDPNDGGDGWGDDPATPGSDEGANDDFGDLRLSSTSPCIDAGSSNAVLADELDLDGDGDVEEKTPYDLDRSRRLLDDALTADAGWGPVPEVDMGAYEYHLVGDMNCDGTVGFGDINPFVLALTTDESSYYAAYPDCNYLNADLNQDGSVGFADINPFVYVLTH